MTRSDSIAALAGALAKAQGAMEGQRKTHPIRSLTPGMRIWRPSGMRVAVHYQPMRSPLFKYRWNPPRLATSRLRQC
jgi:hypothetical protein